MKFNDALIGGALVLFASAILWYVRNFPPMPGQEFGPSLFPRFIASGLLVCGVALIVSGAKRWRAEPVVELSDWLRMPRLFVNFCLVAGGMVFYILLSDTLGFLITMPIVLTVWIVALKTRWSVALPVAVVVTLLIHYIFYGVLKVPLPWGFLSDFAW